jgi:alkylation response protein AidB-like acyl-CoA dehydrogenase
MALIELTPRQKQLKQEVEEFLKEELTSEVAELFDPKGPFSLKEIPPLKNFANKLGKKGWLLPWLPEDWGGLNLSNVDTLFLNDALSEHGAMAPLTMWNSGVGIIGPSLFLYGNEEQKREFLPKIARGEIEWSLGYTEPEAGTDLASLQMRAVQDGDFYIINGQKVFQTGADTADYHWLLARTDPSVSKHKGITLFIVDLKSPGITVKPMWCIGDEHTNEVFYDDVRVHKNSVVGKLNQGFSYVMTALAFERNYPTGGQRWLLNRLLEFARKTKLCEDPIIRQKLAEKAIELEVVSLFSYKIASTMDEGKMGTYEISMVKIFESEFAHRLYSFGLELMGSFGLMANDSEWGHLTRSLQGFYQRGNVQIFGAGTNDMLRSYMCTRGFGMPPAW